MGKCNHQGFLLPLAFEIKDYVKDGTVLQVEGPQILTTASLRMSWCFNCDKVFQVRPGASRIPPPPAAEPPASNQN